ncbi:unnamed protein product [Chilo suppressalis]|uniref:Cathepsin propeptide inhibitor domain-containing protein n=1 Tax=Chilo suppressalis TaxID=168631 RepID=A0ABN8AU64_CHISP|nr:unnamed protein product [Chilo suppressalis]
MQMLCYYTILSLVFATFVSAGDVYYDPKDAPLLFHKFIRDYGRRYRDTEELLYRYVAFTDTLAEINRLNAAHPDATFTINEFADYFEAEKKWLNGVKRMS